MKDDIKEILEELKEKEALYNNYKENDIVPNEYYKSHKILDYITNLQKENKRLKELCDKYEEEHSSTFKEWQKAIKENERLKEDK